MALDEVLNQLRQLEKKGEITAWITLPAKPGSFRDLPEELDEGLAAALLERGVRRLYEHQAVAFQEIIDGRNVVIVTPTASGKTLCYNLPILQTMAHDPEAKALYLFPTKALAQDQMAELQDLSRAAGLSLGLHTYDGDTPDDMRRRIREKARIVLSNPDMLHSAILPHHPRWAGFFQNLRYVVIDELHTYRGIFGSHVANVFRRLKRVARFYNSPLQFVCTSATIANPAELAEALLEEPVRLLDRSGAPTSKKELIFYNPPIINPDLGLRRSALSSARRFAERFLKERVQTIVFATSRLNVEVLLRYLQRGLAGKPGQKIGVRGYRGGYLPRTRREIERQLRSGELLGVVSTNALELGIDIGSLQACILAGYPGSVASTWQQVGRAGRRSGTSVAIVVGRNLPLDQFMVSHPDYFMERSPEHGLIHADNLQILVSHVKCAAFELPFQENESFGRENLTEILEFLSEQGTLCRSGSFWHWSDEAYPANSVSLRNIPEENFVLFNRDDQNRAIAEVDFDSAPELIHDDAVYMCEGKQYHVEQLDYDGRKAYLREVEVDYFTEAISYSGLRILQTDGRSLRGQTEVAHGEVHLFKKVPGFKKIKFYTSENVGFGKIHLPIHELHTTSAWITVSAESLLQLGLSRDGAILGLLGVSYAMRHLATLLLMCDVRDLGRSVGDRSSRWFAQSGREGLDFYSASGEREDIQTELLDSFDPTIFLYDNYPGGVGFSQTLFDSYDELVRQSLRLIESCACRGGCPSCVGPVEEIGRETKSLSLQILSFLASTIGSDPVEASTAIIQ